MKFELNNMGIIKEAAIEIDGITVIAGENDSGKSTVGKSIFSIIKAVSRYKEDFKDDKEEKINKIIDDIYFYLRRSIDFSTNIEIREVFYPPKFKEDFQKNQHNSIDRRKNFLENYIKNLNLIDIQSFDKFYHHIKKRLELLVAISDESKTKTDLIKVAFKKAIFSEFKNEITPNGKISKISISEFNNQIINCKFTNSDILDFNVLDDLYHLDATFIETPVVLHLNELIDNSKTYFDINDLSDKINRLDVPNVVLHTKDLINKLKESIYEDDFLIEIRYEDLMKIIEDAINGEFKYNKKSKEFEFIKNEQKIKSLNVASGIKSFGIIQLLLKSGLLNERSLLILDEPEVHLHPKWQLIYAKVMTILSSYGINILVTTHSPYMIEAFEKYSKIYDVKTNFYFAENGIITENNNSLAITYEKLSEPFVEFENIDLEIFDKK
jgi:predicted ATPase